MRRNGVRGLKTMADEWLKGRRIAVVIVSYRTGRMVLAALPALMAELAACARSRVVVVDNASPDGDGDLLEAGLAAGAFGEGVALIRSPVNGGFAAGNNLGFAALRALDWTPEAVLLLNPDAEILPGALVEMLAVMDAHPRAGVVGARLKNPDGSTWSAAFNFPSAAREFAAATGLGLFARLRPILVAPAAPARVDWVSGAAMMLRWSALEALGDMDEGYFLYFEEVDYMRRAERLGWEVWTAPAALIAHEAGGATGLVDERPRAGRMPDYWFASWRRYFARNHGRGYARLAAAAKICGLLIGAAQRRLRGRPDPHPPRFLRDFAVKALWALNRDPVGS
jgi:GT2 family glycosyltransferase